MSVHNIWSEYNLLLTKLRTVLPGFLQHFQNGSKAIEGKHYGDAISANNERVLI